MATQESIAIGELIVKGLAAILTLRVVRLVLAAFSATALHELGHLLFGRIAGLPVLGIVIGEGRRLFRCRIGTINFSLHAVPVGGYLEHGEYRASPLRCAALAVGGIAVNLVTGISCLAFYLFGELPNWADMMLCPLRSPISC